MSEALKSQITAALIHSVKRKQSEEEAEVRVNLQAGRLLSLSLQTPVFLLLDEGGGAGGRRGRERGGGRVSGGVGGEPVVQGLPLVLDERVLLDHHSLEAGEGMNDACIWDLCTDLEQRRVCFWYLQ